MILHLSFNYSCLKCHLHRFLVPEDPVSTFHVLIPVRITWRNFLGNNYFCEIVYKFKILSYKTVQSQKCSS